MVTQINRAPAKRAQRKKIFSQPRLKHVMFTKCQSARTVDEDGFPLETEIVNAVLKLTASLGCKLPDEDDGQFSLTVDVEAAAVMEDADDEFYSGQVAVIALFERPNEMPAANLEAIVKSADDYLRPAYNILYAIAVKELERLIESVGLPAPVIPMYLEDKIKVSSVKKASPDNK